MNPIASDIPTGKVVAIIPSRFGSTRFPAKPLALIAGQPMIQHVVNRARQALRVQRVVVATDDIRIAQAVEAFGGEALMTGDLPTGTDRIAQAASLLEAQGEQVGWVMNVQGDEPLVDPQDLDMLVAHLTAIPGAVMGTLAFPLHNQEAFLDPNVVKVVTDHQGRALYFSRAPIPYPRETGHWGQRHMGIYLFRRDFLATFAALAPTPLAIRESLEQLRALENGYPIHCFTARTFSVGVDVPQDIQRVEAELARLR